MRRAASTAPRIVWTRTDEAPALASYALLPVIRRFTEPAGIDVSVADISVAGRIIAAFSDQLAEGQRQPDELAQLGDLAKTPEANIVKLPNVSASVPQLSEAIAELQSKGYALPAYNPSPSTEEEKSTLARYSKILGSAVNPVLREGNSDRRVAAPVKAYAQKNPHKMGQWPKGSRTRVAHMADGDFYGSEQSAVMKAACDVRIEHVSADGSTTVMSWRVICAVQPPTASSAAASRIAGRIGRGVGL